MSFIKMKRDDLYELATENFGVEVSQTANKEQIIAALAEMGVTWDMAKVYDKNAATIAEQEEEARKAASQANVITSAQAQVKTPEPQVTVSETPRGVNVAVEAPVQTAPVQPEVILLKMERENPTYEIRGHKFTRANPFALVQVDDASYILENIEGFKQASPKEAKEFYG